MKKLDGAGCYCYLSIGSLGIGELGGVGCFFYRFKSSSDDLLSVFTCSVSSS
jgi:hypothetical protein